MLDFDPDIMDIEQDGDEIMISIRGKDYKKRITAHVSDSQGDITFSNWRTTGTGNWKRS